MDAPATPLARGFQQAQQPVHHRSESMYVDAGLVTETVPLETPKGPPLAREATGVPGIHLAQYANVDVVEQNIQDHIVMRRLSDGSVNATQSSKVAGLDRSRRQKVSDREIGSKFEKVQGGTGKYQGTWVPLESAVELAKQYEVFDVSHPSSTFDVSNTVLPRSTPTQREIEEQRRLMARSRSNADKSTQRNGQGEESAGNGNDQGHAEPSVHASEQSSNNFTNGNMSISMADQSSESQSHLMDVDEPTPQQTPAHHRDSPSHPEPQAESSRFTDRSSNEPSSATAPNTSMSGVDIVMSARPNSNSQTPADGDVSVLADSTHIEDAKNNNPSASEMAAAAAAAASVISPVVPENSFEMGMPIPSDDDLVTLEPLEPREGDTSAELSREAVTDSFSNSSKMIVESLDEIMVRRGITTIEPDVPIDDAGHTASHWAAALGQLSLVSDLLKHGANCRRGNRKGESASVRAVLVTNSSDNQTFGDLLNLLYPCSHLGDFNGRTVLHHIALTAGIPGRIDASRYYLDALLEWAVKWRGANGVKWSVDELVDSQDANGDTALNIAARSGSKRIAQQLIEVGASVNISNRAGLGPKDFGSKFDVANDSQPGTAGSDRPVDFGFGAAIPFSKPSGLGHSRAGSRALVDGNEKRQMSASKCNVAITELEMKLNQSLEAKNNILKHSHAKSKAATEQSDRLVAEKEFQLSLKRRRDRSEQRLAASDAAIEHVNTEFQKDTNQHFADTPSTTYDADEPFQIVDEESLFSLPPAISEARIKAYRANEQKLLKLRDQSRMSSLEGEAKYRKVVAQCTSNDVSKVDEILEDLSTAVIKGDQKMDFDS